YSVTENCEIREFQIGELPPVWLELAEDQTIAVGESIELQAETNAQPVIISWYNSSGILMLETHLGIIVQPAENTLYSIEIQDLNGCLLKDSIWVLVEEINGRWFAPNVIHPLSEGSNGWFTLFASPDHITEIQVLEIYDRWGNLVFTRKNFPPNAPESGWDGTQNGKMGFNPAVFVWHAVLLLQNGNSIKVKGDVTVVR
ncbi:MAG: gliding motility-associated C-terminal domain-containing protein, partial [Saprospiraceae bacterium]